MKADPFAGACRGSPADAIKPEGEGIDATLVDGALLHTLTGEPLKLTSWVDHFVVQGP